MVGDHDQSIYAWRGADMRNILDFERDYPDAEVVKLERNYRSTQPILDGRHAASSPTTARAASAGSVTEREGGEPIRLFEAADDREEAQFVVREIVAAVRERGPPLRRLRDLLPHQRAVARLRGASCSSYDVPYVVVGGVRFYDRAEVKDALAYLRLLRQPADAAALRRIVNRPARGIGKATRRARRGAWRSSAACPLLEGLKRFAASEDGRARRAEGPRASSSCSTALAREIAAARARRGDRARARTQRLPRAISSARAAPRPRRGSRTCASCSRRREDFERANAEIRDDERSLLELFLDQVALVSDLDEYDRRDEVVSLMTVHSAKGLEFPVVYLVGHGGGHLPARGLAARRRRRSRRSGASATSA